MFVRKALVSKAKENKFPSPGIKYGTGPGDFSLLLRRTAKADLRYVIKYVDRAPKMRLRNTATRISQ
jgi:hypothetical protein